jgi:TonB family protein
MHRCITLAIILITTDLPLLAEQEPPEDVFSHSSGELVFQIPAGFELIEQNRKYLRADIREVPRYRRIWQRGSEGIIETVVLVPEVAWTTKNAKEILGFGISLADPTLKIASQRDYQFDGVPAVSITCFYDKPGGTSQRLDCFLVKPYMFMVAYVSAKPSSWDDPGSKAFFQTIRLEPKQSAAAQTPPPMLARPSPEVRPTATVTLMGEDRWKLAISHPTPEYPLEARRRHFAGAGVFELSISEDTGEVSSVKVVTSTGYPVLDRAAVKTLKLWKFRPHSVIRVKLPITFSLHKSSSGAKKT